MTLNFGDVTAVNVAGQDVNRILIDGREVWAKPSAGYGYCAVDIAINESNPSTRCTYPRTITVNGSTVPNACYGFTPASGASRNFAMNSWDGHKLIEGIKPVYKNGDEWGDLDRENMPSWQSSYDCFTEFPFNWLSITNDGTRIRVIFSDNDTQPDSTFQCYAHAKGCDAYSNAQIKAAVSTASRNEIMESNSNSYFANAFHIGCFLANNRSSALYSKRGATATGSLAYAYYWQYANARGTDYDCMSFQQWTYLQALFVLLYKSTNSQVAHSYGLASGSMDTANAGMITTSYGMAGSTSSAHNSFFWINDIWGNMFQYIGGAWNRAGSSSKLYYWLPRQANSRAFNNGWTAATTKASQASLGDDTGLSGVFSINYIKTVAGTNTGGFCPTSQSGGSSTTYFTDYGYVGSDSSYARFPYVGGYYGDGVKAGIFGCYVDYASTDSFFNCGARLAYRGGH